MSALAVLIVEDSESDTELLVQELRRIGFSPRWERVDTAPALRRALVSRTWQLVMCGSSVPRLDVLDALRITRALAPDVPIIVVSATITEEIAVQVFRSGVADYVAKDCLARLGPSVARELADADARARQGVCHRLLMAQEDELRRFARTAHDQLGALLTAARLGVASAQLARGTARERALDEALEAVDQAIAQARDLSLELWPTILDDAGLGPALRWLAELLERRIDVAIQLDLDEVGRLPQPVEAAGFRIVQEALTNVARHARARHLDIRLREVPGAVEVTVRDDGKGFDVQDVRGGGASATLGLVGMQQRARLAGGQLEIASAPGGGTTVRARLPVTFETRHLP